MAELADALALGASGVTRESSSLSFRTRLHTATMQVSIENTGGLERKMTVVVPAEKITSAVEKKLHDMSSTARIDGFRPGKVPVHVVRQRFGKQAFQDVVTDVMYSSYRHAVRKENLRPVGRPQIETSSLNAGQDLKYVATFEVYPEIKLKDVSEFEIPVAEVEITAKDLDEMLEKLRRKKMLWSEVDRKAKKNDRVTIDFEGTIDGKAFAGGRGDDFAFVLGGNRMLPEFEEQLQGLKKDEKKSFQVTFAKDYVQEELAEKAAAFEVRMKKVEAGKLPELNDAFVRECGIEDGDLETLKKRLKRDMDAELERRKKAFDKDQVMRCLLEANEFEVPVSLIQQEVRALRKQGTGTENGADLPDTVFEDEARRRTSIGLIIGEIIHHNKIELDTQRVNNYVNLIASGYARPEDVIKHYHDNRQAMATVESLVMEDQVVEWVLERSRQTSRSFTFHEFMSR